MTNLVARMVEDGEEHGGRVHESFGEEPAVDGEDYRREESEVAQDQEQRFGEKVRLKQNANMSL